MSGGNSSSADVPAQNACQSMPDSSKSEGGAGASAPKKRRCVSEIINKVKTVLPSGEHRCVVDPDCVYTQTKLVVGNFKRHIQSQHPKEFVLLGLGEADFTKYEDKRDPVLPVRMSPLRLLGGLVKMITVNGIPFKGIDWEGMQDIIRPYCDAMNMTVNSHNIRQYVSKTAAGIDKEIRSEVAGVMLSLKADIASKMHRSVLGLNVQFIDCNGILQKQTLAILELNVRHTGANLKEEVFRILDRFGIRPQQIYSITIDNGSNMVKMAFFVGKETMEEYELDESSTIEETAPVETVGESSIEEEHDAVVEGMLQDMESIITHTAVTVRCGAHTVQLAVTDACKGYQPELKKLSKLVASYHNAKYKNFFDVSGGKYPPIPVPTRWNSNYMMNVSLLDQKEFFIKLGQEFEELDLSDQWGFIEAYVEAFEPLYDCTIAIQKLNCTLSDFFGQWMTAYGRVASLQPNMFKEALLEAMGRREQPLFNNYAMQAALYVDPRFSFRGSGLFSPQQKENVVYGSKNSLMDNTELDHVTKVIAYHPRYLEHYLNTQNFVMHCDGPLPFEYRSYIAIMAAARHKCTYLVNLYEKEFLMQGGDRHWLNGLDYIPAKLRAISDINKILAHRPWLLNKEHIERLTKGQNSWSLSEVVHAIVLLAHFHSLSSFVFSCGLTQELDTSSQRIENNNVVPQKTETEHNHHHHLYQNGQEAIKPPPPQSVEVTTVDALMQRMKKLSENNTECTEMELSNRFKNVEMQAAELPAVVQREPALELPQQIGRYVDDPNFTYQDFARRGAENIPQTFRIQDYSWDDHGYSLVNRLYNDVGFYLDDKFRLAYNLTYYTIAGRTNVDTSKFRRAIWNYIQCMYGIRYDDYDYGEVNQLLDRALKMFIKTACCFPERITKTDYDSVLVELQHSEKVHVNLMILEARNQAELLYALREIMRYMT